MTVKTTKLRDAIVYALVAGATGVAGTGVAFAQDTAQEQPPAAQQPAAQQQAQQLDTIVVTGTRIQSQTVTSSSPVTEIAKEEFQYTGASRAEDLVNQYPQLTPAFDAFTNNGAVGYPTVDLRGLGAARTLTLVNGYRLAPGALEVPDISIVPPIAIKRVDILTGGASAVYGSDAIAGVVNFVLDDEFEGVALSAGYSAYQHNNDNSYMQGLQDEAGFDYENGDSGFDGASRNIDMVVGSSFADDRGHAMAWASWRKNDPLFQGQRDYASCALNSAGTACGGSATNAAGNFYLYQLLPDGPDDGTDPDPFGTEASLNPDGSWTGAYGVPYNYAPINYYQRPDERYSLGASLKYEINEHFRPYLEAMFINKQDSIQIAESGTFFTRLPDQPCTNPLLGTMCSDLGLDPTLPVGIYVAKRNIEGGPRITNTENTQWRVVAGVEGALDEAWAYNATFLHAQNSQYIEGHNDFLFDRVNSAILGCLPGDTFPGCIPYNVWEPNSVTPEAAAALAGVSFSKTTTELNSVNTYVTGDTGLSLPWVDESISLVMGAEWRETTFAFQADTNSQEGNFAGSGGPATPVSGKTSVSELFLESAVPLISEAGPLTDLDLDLGYRLSDYDRSGRANTYKVGLTANFIDQVRVRASYNRAIRAPSVVNLFNPQSIALFVGDDPCAGVVDNDPETTSPTLTPEQCLNTGVPLDRYGTVAANPAGQNNQFIGGNPDLSPEEAETFTFGVVYTPTSDLQFNADYYQIELTDAIATIGAGTILQFCGLTGDPFLCDKVNRSATLDLFRGSNPATSGYVVNLTDNFGDRTFRGIDLGGRYRMDLGPGRLNLSLQGSYLLEQEIVPLPGVNDDATYDCAGKINPACQAPEWRHIANARYSMDRYTFNLRWRYYGEMDYTLQNGDPGTADQLTADNGGIDAYNYFDASASAFIGDFTEVTLGVNNIADKEPPLIGGANAPANANSLAGYDQAGRFFYGSITFRF